MRRDRRGYAVAAAAGLLLSSVTVAGAAVAAPGPPQQLQQAVTLDNTLQHLRNLQRIADANGGRREAGGPGHAASAGYVAGQLAAAGYDVQLQRFEFPYFTENTPPVLARTKPTAKTYTVAQDFLTMQYSGSGDVTAPVTAVDLVLPPGAEPNTSTSGCEPADFTAAGFTRGHIALLQRGTCPFATKATNAAAAGAVAVIIFNEGQPASPQQPEDRTVVLAGDLQRPDFEIPVLGASFAVGVELSATGTVARVRTDTTSETRPTFNMLAESPQGRADNVVMSGAHLDSVPAGPGINDNGSGSAALLEVAIQFAKKVDKPKNKVRFAWWSAEEFGLLGSKHYVDTLPAAQLGDIAVYLNYDMVGSPNYANFVYDGDDSDHVGAGPGPQGSGAVEDVFEAFYAGRSLPSEGTDFDGRSDYGPFIAAGIPSGGLFTGAEGIKTPQQAQRYGGTAGIAFDACYHKPCDTTRNISNRALDINADAIAYATATLARDTSAVNERARATREAVSKSALDRYSNLLVR